MIVCVYGYAGAVCVFGAFGCQEGVCGVVVYGNFVFRGVGAVSIQEIVLCI